MLTARSLDEEGRTAWSACQRAAKESVKGSDERLIEQLSPGVQVVRAIPAAAAQVRVRRVQPAFVLDQALGARGTATSLAMRYLNEPKRN